MRGLSSTLIITAALWRTHITSNQKKQKDQTLNSICENQSCRLHLIWLQTQRRCIASVWAWSPSSLRKASHCVCTARQRADTSPSETDLWSEPKTKWKLNKSGPSSHAPLHSYSSRKKITNLLVLIINHKYQTIVGPRWGGLCRLKVITITSSP